MGPLRIQIGDQIYTYEEMIQLLKYHPSGVIELRAGDKPELGVPALPLGSDTELQHLAGEIIRQERAIEKLTREVGLLVDELRDFVNRKKES